MTDATPPTVETDTTAPSAQPGPIERTPSVRGDGGWRVLSRRLLYWLPVLLAMVFFGQVALLGLRPALREKERLAEAEVVLRERHARDTVLASSIALHLRARQDPVFQERQRRLRELPPEARPKSP